MAGAFGLSAPEDLLAKLRRELERLRDAPNDHDAAINFFVTAEHMLDWLMPGTAGRPKREQLRNSEPLLQVVSHLASGAKHHSQLLSHHQAVSQSGETGGYFAAAYFSPRYFGSSYFGGRTLSVTLTGNAAQTLGPSLSAVALAEQVYSYWQARLRKNQSSRTAP